MPTDTTQPKERQRAVGRAVVRREPTQCNTLCVHFNALGCSSAMLHSLCINSCLASKRPRRIEVVER